MFDITYKALLGDYRALLSEYMSLLSEYRALLSDYRDRAMLHTHVCEMTYTCRTRMCVRDDIHSATHCKTLQHTAAQCNKLHPVSHE